MKTRKWRQTAAWICCLLLMVLQPAAAGAVLAEETEAAAAGAVLAEDTEAAATGTVLAEETEAAATGTAQALSLIHI